MRTNRTFAACVASVAVSRGSAVSCASAMTGDLLDAIDLPLEFPRGFRIHRRGAAERDLGRQPVLLAEFLQKRILPREIVRDDAVWAVDFFDGRARVRRNLLVGRPAI